MDDEWEWEFESRMVDHIISMMCLASTAHCTSKEQHDTSMAAMAEMIVASVMVHNHGSDQQAAETMLKKLIGGCRGALLAIKDDIPRTHWEGHA